MRCQCCEMGVLNKTERYEVLEQEVDREVIRVNANDIPVFVCNVFITADTLHTRQRHIDEALKKRENNASI